MTEEPELLTGAPDALDAIVAEMHSYADWPVDPAKDRRLALELTKTYPTLDLLEQIQMWRVWMLDHDDKGKEVRVRARLNTWCRNAVRFAGRGGSSAGVRPTSGRAGTRARTAQEFGDTTGNLDGW